MTEAEALKLLSNYVIDTRLGVKVMVDTSDFMNTCEEALEKQIPKKPIIDIGYDTEGNAWNNWRCPCCRKNYLLDDEEYNYCSNCGQKIDWGNEE